VQTLKGFPVTIALIITIITRTRFHYHPCIMRVHTHLYHIRKVHNIGNIHFFTGKVKVTRIVT